MKRAIQAIDCVVNPITPEIMKLRPAWSTRFWTTKMGRGAGLAKGLPYVRMLKMMDAWPFD